MQILFGNLGIEEDGGVRMFILISSDDNDKKSLDTKVHTTENYNQA